MPGHKSDYLEFGVKVGLDSKEAQKELQELQKQLNSLGTLSNPKVGDKLSADMQKASQAAAQLKIALDSAIDIDTGKLDLSKFSRSLKDSGMKLKDYRDQLMSMGSEGEKAFTQVANSILKAEAPLRRTSKLVDTMWTTLKNTARWELSSSIFHGLEGSLQKAVSYAQDLNKSLTNIRIVTGYSTDHMADFAVEANKAAKALSVTTTEYTNASLIYFQQGLSDQQVKERTEVTVKMANVSRESAQTVSDQMTAVWNNFADGSHTLEYYADVMTALGAATASSTKEISDGLEKFAAVAETVGLSYEYAASALATITSNTRQSADVVGTALKTLFARIQGLSLGETLEDGTDLNKYSEALAKVGISIKDQNGELKAMDNILNEMAAKWGTLNNDQQVALAQTVAGVRQYTQLVALMENWDNGDEDSMMANLNTSANATGALQEQADIYAESWEAARDRVTAALESIFNKLLKDEFFIDTLNNIEKIITGIDKFIDRIGGLQGVLTGLGAVATKVFSGQISSGLQNLAYNLNFNAAKERDKQMRIDAANAESSMLVDTHPGQSEAYKKIGQLQVMMIERADQMSDTEKELANHTIERYKNLAKQTEELAKQVPILKAIAEQADNEVESGKREVSSEWAKEHGAEYAIRKDYDKNIADIDKYIEDLAPDNKKEREIAIANREELKKERDLKIETSHAREKDQQELISRKDNLKKAINQRDIAKVDASKAERENKILEKQREELKALGKDYSEIDKKIDENQKSIKKWAEEQKELNDAVDKAGREYKEVAGEVVGAKDMAAFENASIADKMNDEAPDILKEAGDEAEEQILRAKGNMQSFADGIVGAANGIASLAFGLQSFGAIWDALENPDMTAWEKVTSILTTVGFAIPSIISGFSSLTTAMEIFKNANITSLPSLAAYAMGIDISKAKTKEETIALIANNLAKKTGITITAGTTAADVAAAAAKSGHTVATTLLAAAQAFLNGQFALGLSLIFPYIAAIGLLVGAIIGLKVLFDHLQESSPEGQLKKLTEEAEASANAAKEAEEAYNNLKASVESYDSAIDSLAGLTKGTEEFKAAVEEANKKAQELIDTYNIVEGVYLDKDGVIRFEEGTFNGMISEAEEAKRGSAITAYSDQQKVIAQQYEVDMINTVKGLIEDIDFHSFDSDIDAKLANNLDQILKIAADENQELDGERLAQILGRNYEAGSPFANYVDTLAQKLESSDAAVASAQAEINKNTAALDSNTAALLAGNNIYGDEEWYQNSEYKNTIASQGAEYAAEKRDAYYEEIKNNKGKITNENGETIDIDDYLKDEMDYEWVYNEEAKKYQWLNRNTGEYSDLTKDEKYELYASNEAQKDAIEYGKNLYEDMSSMDPLLAKAIEARNSGEDLTYDEIVALKEGSNNGRFNEDIINMTDKDAESHGLLDGLASWIEGLNEYQNLDKIYANANNELATSKDVYDQNKYQKGLEEARTWWESLPEEDRELALSIDFSKDEDSWQEQLDEIKEETAYSIGVANAEAAGFDPEVYETFFKTFKEGHKDLKITEEQMHDLALANMQCEAGLKEIAENWDDWQEALKKTGTEEAAKAQTELNKALAKVVNVNEAMTKSLPADFAKKYKKEIDAAIKGEKGAVQKLQELILDTLNFEDIDFIELGFNIEGIENEAQQIFGLIQDLNMEDIEIGTSLETSDFAKACNYMLAMGKITGEQMVEYLKMFGFDSKVNTKEVSLKAAVEMGSMTMEQAEEGIANGLNWETKVRVPALEVLMYDGSSFGGDFPEGTDLTSSDNGGSGSSAEPLEYEDEIERYHENTRAIERLTRALDKVSTAKDRAFGKERLRLIDEEIAATERLVAQQRALLHETKEYLKQDFAEIQQYGFTFDEHGEITNYDEVMKQQIDKYNAAVASGNQAAIDAAKKEYEEFKENMQQYEETLTAYEEAQAQLQEYINQVVDLKLEKITTEVEIKILVNDKELTRLEYLLRKIEYEGKGAADAISLMGRQFEQINEKAKPIQEAIDKIYEQARAEGRGLLEEEVMEIKSFYQDGVISSEEEKRIQEIYDKAASEDRMLTQAEEEQIQEYKEQLLELNEEVMDLVETVEGKFMETLEELNGKVDESIGRFATYAGMFQTLSDVITLSGKAGSKYGMDMLNTLSARTVANASAAMRSNLQSYEALNKIYQDEQANLERAIKTGDERLIKQYTERLHEVEMMRETSYDSMLSSWSEALQAANDLFDTKLTNMITSLKQNLGDIDKLVEIYDRAVELEDLYVSGNKSIYELSKLARDIGKDIDKTANIIAKNKLTGLLEQINKLRAEGVKLSQYDLEYWQAKYELELAEIALQEAQEAKAQVKLTRNTAGGWGYVYTADAEAINEAQQNYEDSLYNMQELHDEYIRDYSERLIKNRQELVNALQDLDKTSLTFEEDALRLKEHHFKQEEYLIDELNKAYQRAGVSYQDTLLAQTYGGASLEDSHTNFINSVVKMIQDELLPGYQEFQESVDDINSQAGTTVEDAMDKIFESSMTMEDEVIKNINDLTSGVKEVSDEIWNFQETYGEAIAEMLKDNEDYYSKTIKMYKNFMDETEADKWLQYFDDMRSPGEVLGLAGSGATGAMAGNGATSITNKGWQGLIEALGISYSNGNSSSKSKGGDRDGEVWVSPTGHYSTSKGIWDWQAGQSKEDVIAEFKEKGYSIKEVDSVIDGMNKDREKLGLPLLATGGYTGSWGPEGKLAVLHEKELVLNKYDTENMLDMVNTLRDIDWRAKLSELWTNIEEHFITPIFGGGDNLQQDVRIEASFPGVSNHTEIEEAFNNLINTASQYANRKKY